MQTHGVHICHLHTFFFIQKHVCIYTQKAHNTHHTLMQTHTPITLHTITYICTAIDMGTHTWTNNRTSSSSANLLPVANVNRSTASHTKYNARMRMFEMQ